MQAIISVDPFRCRMWDLHDRLANLLTEESCREEIGSFAEHGQLVPALARPLRGDPDFDYELVCGSRRLFAARFTNKPLLLDVRNLSDVEAIVAMDIENRHRKDISPYERGLSYARCLRQGEFHSQEQLARSLKISASQVSRLLSLAKLPSVILAAFGSGTDIRESWGVDLVNSLDDQQRRRTIIQTARMIAAMPVRPGAPEIYRRLLASSSTRGRKVRSTVRDDIVTGQNGLPLFRIKFRHNAVALWLPARRVSLERLVKVRHAIAGILQAERAEVVDLKAARSRLLVSDRGVAQGCESLA